MEIRDEPIDKFSRGAVGVRATRSERHREGSFDDFCNARE